MNHGLINKFIYAGKVSTDSDLYIVYPELNRLYEYFSKVNRRDRYYVAMKYHAVKLAKQIYPEIVLDQLSDLVNVKNHATAYYYMNNYVPLEGHGAFIKEHFDHFVDNYIYPITTKHGKERDTYGLYKQVTLDKLRENYLESPPKKKKTTKRYNNVYAVKRDKKERY
jgi:hypothetical protein